MILSFHRSYRKEASLTKGQWLHLDTDPRNVYPAKGAELGLYGLLGELVPPWEDGEAGQGRRAQALPKGSIERIHPLSAHIKQRIK